MTTASETLHEPASNLEPATIERHRALSSLKEELSALEAHEEEAEPRDSRQMGSLGIGSLRGRVNHD